MPKKKAFWSNAAEFVVRFILTYAVVLALFIAFQDSFIFHPKKEPLDIRKYQQYGYQELTLETEPKLISKAWYLPPKNNKPVLVYFHGNAGSVSRIVPYLGDFAAQGYGILLPEYRGYAGSDGKPSEEGFYRDARAWLRWLATEREIPTNRVFLYGQSMGCGVAVQMAVDFPDIRALLLLAPATSRVDISFYRYPIFPFQLFQRTKFDNMAKIKKVKANLLIVYGARDMIVPPSMGRALFENANQPKNLVVIPEAGHNNLYRHGVASIAFDFFSAVEKSLKPQRDSFQ